MLLWLREAEQQLSEMLYFQALIARLCYPTLSSTHTDDGASEMLSDEDVVRRHSVELPSW